jgi:hypothetical protein
MVGKPPLLKQAIPAWNSPEKRLERQLEYVAVLIEEARIDVKRVPPGDAVFALTSPYEERGYTSHDIEKWIADCEKPPPPSPGPVSWDPIGCFRDKARAAMQRKPGLGTKLALIGGASFLAAFVATRWWR